MYKLLLRTNLSAYMLWLLLSLFSQWWKIWMQIGVFGSWNNIMNIHW